MASKSKSRRRVLRASCLLAALIVAGSSFAWFASKDEVTNRLTASSNYGVAIAEDFTPPENWIPGQEINKDVGVVNTGNVDAFTRVWLEGEMNILNKKPSDAVAETKGSPADISGVKTVTDNSLLAMGLKYNDGGTYYRILGKTEVDNPEDDNTAANQDTTVNDKTYSEVKAVQAGGWLAYASDSAAFTFIPEQEYTYTKASGDGTTTVAADTEVASSSVYASWRNGAGLAIDSDTFKPTADGLYIFRRIINDKSTEDGYSYEYSGYYYDSDKDEYFALEYKTSDNSDYVIDPTLLTITHSIVNDATTPVVKVENGGVKLFQAQYTEVENSGLKWVYNASDKTLTAIYVGADGKYKTQLDGATKKDYSADDIAVVVKLADTGTSGQTWNGITSTGTAFTYYADGDAAELTSNTVDQKTTFYYNDDVEENDTTARLVDSVTLSSDTKKEAFLAFDFDLNVKMDSIQVTKDATGNEGFETVKTGWDSDNTNVTKAKATATVGSPEINSITWEATT